MKPSLRERARFFHASIAGILALGLIGVPEARGASVDANDAPPEYISYQGYLTDAATTPVALDGEYQIIFRIYDEQSASTVSATQNLLWTERQTVTVDNGYFAVFLGAGEQEGTEAHDPLSEVFDSTTASERFIGITVEGLDDEAEIAPRQQLLTSPYAFLASKALKADRLSGTELLVDSAGNVDVENSLDVVSDANIGGSINMVEGGHLTLFSV